MADEAPDAAPIVLDDTDAQVGLRGHRQLDEIWTCYKKVMLENFIASCQPTITKLQVFSTSKLHRRYDATCNSCSKVLPGKPAVLRQHTANCKSDCKQLENDFLMSDTGFHVDLDLDHPALSDPGNVPHAAAPVRAEVGTGQGDCDIESLIATE